MDWPEAPLDPIPLEEVLEETRKNIVQGMDDTHLRFVALVGDVARQLGKTLEDEFQKLHGHVVCDTRSLVRDEHTLGEIELLPFQTWAFEDDSPDTRPKLTHCLPKHVPDEIVEPTSASPRSGRTLKAESRPCFRQRCKTVEEVGATMLKQLQATDHDRRSTVSTSPPLTGSFTSEGPLTRLVKSRAFDSFFGVAIFMNCATMGVDAHMQAGHDIPGDWPRYLAASEHIFTAMFATEVALKLSASGWREFLPTNEVGARNFLDMVLAIFIGVVFAWVIPVVRLVLGYSGGNGALGTLSVLRALRLARVVRMFQKIPAFREAWMLIQGLGHSVRTLFWTFVVIGIMTYVFAIVGLTTMVPSIKEAMESPADPTAQALAEQLWPLVGGLDRFMYTLVQGLLGDSFHAITRNILYIVSWSWIYFYAYIGIAVIVMMNLVTAIIVDNALTRSKIDEENEKKVQENIRSKELQDLRNMFGLMDTDGSGTLNWEEFKSSFKDSEMRQKWAVLDFRPQECKELFDLLDDGDGEIETVEFFEGLARMKGVAQSKDIYRVQKAVNRIAEIVALSLGAGNEEHFG